MPRFSLTSGFPAHFVQAAAGTNTAGDDEYDDDDRDHYTHSNRNGFELP